MNCLARLRFVGTAYHGTQVQSNSLTVQEVFQETLRVILGSQPDIKCCSRLDTGVHANAFYISFPMEDTRDPAVLLRALNARLPHDIRVMDIRKVHDNFHARYSAAGKRYIYRIWNEAVMDPFEVGRAAFFPRPIDVTALQETARVFLGAHDFRAFTTSNVPEGDSTVRALTFIQVEREGSLVVIRMQGDGFLYHMARSIAGTLLNAAAGKIDRKGIRERLASGVRDRLVATAPAEGLYLDEVFYPAAVYHDE